MSKIDKSFVFIFNDTYPIIEQINNSDNIEFDNGKLILKNNFLSIDKDITNQYLEGSVTDQGFNKLNYKNISYDIVYNLNNQKIDSYITNYKTFTCAEAEKIGLTYSDGSINYHLRYCHMMLH